MKKTKLLMPILATAGLGCAVVPAIALTSCGGKTPTYPSTELEDMTMKTKESTNYYSTEGHTFSTGYVYKTKFKYTASTLSGNFKVDVCYKKDGVEGYVQGIIENSLNIKITYPDGHTLIPTFEATGMGNYTFGNFEAGLDATFEISWRSENTGSGVQFVICNYTE